MLLYLVNKEECNKSCYKFQNEDDSQRSHELEENEEEPLLKTTNQS